VGPLQRRVYDSRQALRYLAMRLLNHEAFRSDTKWIVCIANGRHTA